RAKGPTYFSKTARKRSKNWLVQLPRTPLSKKSCSPRWLAQCFVRNGVPPIQRDDVRRAGRGPSEMKYVDGAPAFYAKNSASVNKTSPSEGLPTRPARAKARRRRISINPILFGRDLRIGS